MVRAQASSARTHLNTLEFDKFVNCFVHIFDRSNHSGCAYEQLFTLQQGNHSVAEYTMEYGTLLEESTWRKPVLLSTFGRGLSRPVRGVHLSVEHD